MLNEAVELSATPSNRTLWTIIGAAMAAFAFDYVMVANGWAESWDDDVILWIHDRSSNTLDRIMRIITDTGGVGRTIPVILVAIFLIASKRRLETFVFLGSVVLAQGATYGLKALVQRERPGLFDLANQPTDTSFPSGHALGSTFLFGLIALWLWDQGIRLPAVALVIWALLVSFSRVYLGAHHPTDVFASICLGVAFLAATVLVYNHLNTEVSLS